jgi:threonine/homoserine/homoserine lactone efflux protein
MNDLAETVQLLPAFLAASVVLAVTPGPGVAYIVARTLAQGRAAGIASALGVAAGNAANAAGAAFGLAALFAASAAAFTVVKWAGAAYLVWLGVRLWRQQGEATTSPPDPAEAADAVPVANADNRRAPLARAGFLVALLNPKTTLFFAAFLPQFVAPQAASPLVPSLLLGAAFVAIALVSDLAYVLGAAWVQPRLARGPARRVSRRLGAVVFVGLGVLAALAQRPDR